MIKFKIIKVEDFGDGEMEQRSDCLINDFFEQNPNIELIDFKITAFKRDSALFTILYKEGNSMKTINND